MSPNERTRPRRGRRQVCAGTLLTTAALAAGLLSACSSSTSEPAASQTTTTASSRLEDVKEAYTFSTAKVEVETSEGSFTATTLDPTDESGYDPADEGSLEVSEADGKGVIITWDAGTEPDVDNAFVRVDLGKTPDMQYPDMVHTQCRVTVPTRTPDEVAGSFTCKDLPNFDDPDKTLAAAKGTFSAHR